MFVFNNNDAYVIDEYYKGFIDTDPYVFDDLIVSLILKDFQIKKEVYKETDKPTRYTVKIRESGFDIYMSTLKETFGVFKAKMIWSEEFNHYVIKQDSYTKYIFLNQLITKDATFIWKMFLMLAFFVLNADKIVKTENSDDIYKSGETGLIYVTENIYDYVVKVVGEDKVGCAELDKDGKSDCAYTLEVE